VLGATKRREILLEKLHLRPHDVAAVIHDAENRGIDRLAESPALGGQIYEGD
jgi:hypothetical protein